MPEVSCSPEARGRLCSMLGSLRYCGHATETPIVGTIKQRVTARDIEWRLCWRDWDAVRSRDRSLTQALGLKWKEVPLGSNSGGRRQPSGPTLSSGSSRAAKHLASLR
jgi:hypothetical protein